MSIFKKKIHFPQLLAELITYQMDFLENNFDRLIALADKSGVLTDSQKEGFLDKAHELIIANIMMGCHQHFSKKISSEEVGRGVRIVYEQYLTEYKKISKTIAETKVEQVSEFLDMIHKMEEKAQVSDEYRKDIGHSPSQRIDNDIDKMKLYLCQAFREYCVGEDTKSEHRESRGFVAFKFAMAFVKADVVAHVLKHYTVTF
jgi:hypothetical protein